jgi:hypothetical protein
MIVEGVEDTYREGGVHRRWDLFCCHPTNFASFWSWVGLRGSLRLGPGSCGGCARRARWLTMGADKRRISRGLRSVEWCARAVKKARELHRTLVARAGIEPATFRFSGGLLAYTSVFQLDKVVLNHRVGRPGAPGPVVWPHFGPIEASGATADGLGAGTAVSLSITRPITPSAGPYRPAVAALGSPMTRRATACSSASIPSTASSAEPP